MWQRNRNMLEGGDTKKIIFWDWVLSTWGEQLRCGKIFSGRGDTAHTLLLGEKIFGETSQYLKIKKINIVGWVGGL